jgi:uncharacterized protein YuzE
VKGIQVVTSEGPRGPAYIRFSNEAVASTEPWENHDEIVVDYDASRAVVGIELVSLGPDVINGLVEIARLNDLDLRALVSHSFDASSAA